jgi:signal transduction histidine kinase
VGAHGGSVVAHSAGRDQGSTFVVTLPRDADAVATEPDAPRALARAIASPP